MKHAHTRRSNANSKAQANTHTFRNNQCSPDMQCSNTWTMETSHDCKSNTKSIKTTTTGFYWKVWENKSCNSTTATTFRGRMFHIPVILLQHRSSSSQIVLRSQFVLQHWSLLPPHSSCVEPSMFKTPLQQWRCSHPTRPLLRCTTSHVPDV